MSFVYALEKAFEEKSNPENTFAMAKYMRNHFSFFGIKNRAKKADFQGYLQRKQRRSCSEFKSNSFETLFKTRTGITVLRD